MSEIYLYFDVEINKGAGFDSHRIMKRSIVDVLPRFVIKVVHPVEIRVEIT